VEAAAIVEAGVLEDQKAEVTLGSHDVVGLFILAELVAVVLTLGFTWAVGQLGSRQLAALNTAT